MKYNAVALLLGYNQVFFHPEVLDFLPIYFPHILSISGKPHLFCARLFICALWSPAGKGLTSWLSFVVSSVSLSLSHWYPGSGVVLDCIDS